MLGAGVLPQAALVPLGGVWADRLPRRTVMVACDAARAVVLGATAVLLLSGSTSLAWLIVAQVLAAVAEAFFVPAAGAIVPEVAPRDRLLEANALLNLTWNVGEIVGPALATLLVGTTGVGGAIALDAASFAASGLLLARVPARAATAAPGDARSTRGELRAGLREVARRPLLLGVVAILGAWALLVDGPVLTLGPVVALDALGGAASWGVVIAAYGIGVVVGAVLALRVRMAPRPLRAAAVGLVADAPVACLLAFAAPVPAIAACALLGGAGSSLALAHIETAVQAATPADVRGRVTATMALGDMLLLPAGLALAGPAAALIGATAVLVASAGAALAMGMGLAAVDRATPGRPGRGARGPRA